MGKMDFTFESYKGLIKLLYKQEYKICDYFDWGNHEKCVIMRHDIDFDVSKAVKMAEIENEYGLASTYFVLVTSDFYNVFSYEIATKLKKIKEYGHNIGLHFDETRYTDIKGNTSSICEKIEYESRLLSHAIDCEIHCVSMHRPSKFVLSSEIKIPNMINSYSSIFFKDFKYLSDSRCCWKEPVIDIINNDDFKRLHILTHPFWYDYDDKSIADTVKDFIERAAKDRYYSVSMNISDIEEIIPDRDKYF